MGGKRKAFSTGSTLRTPSKKPKVGSQGSDLKFKSNTARYGGPIPVDEEEQSFPRGGQQQLTPLEKSIIKTQAERDVLFNEDGVLEKDEVDMEENKSASKQKIKRLNILNRKKLIPGMLILGAVLEVHMYDVVFSLPFNMIGTVAISDVSDHVTKLVESEAQLEEGEGEGEEQDNESSSAGRGPHIPSMEQLFVVGQLMPCYVQAVEDSRISLSVNPRLINSHLTAKDITAKLLLPGYIKSIEDHGYIIDFAIADKTGFLLKKNAAEFIKTHHKGKALSQGQVVHCVVLTGPEARAVPVGINPSLVSTAMISSENMVRVGSLLPGLLVKASVKEVASNGLLMSFLDGFTGVVSTRHLISPLNHPLEKFQVNKKLKARLLWVDVAVKSVGLTLQRELVEGRTRHFTGVEIGDCFEAAKVINVDFTSALYLELANDVIGYAPSWMITDEKLPHSVPIKDRKQYRKGTLHNTRIVQFNLIDGLAIVSLQKSVLERPYMRYSNILAGDLIEGVVERVGSFGMIVSVTESIHGLCPKLHLSDIKTIIVKPEKKYKPGTKVKCRVINVDSSQKRLMLTCKKSFVRCSKEEILSEYTEAKSGDWYRGIITSIRPYGCILHFFGYVRGLVRKSELSASLKDISDPAQLFWLGQSIACRVIECESSTKRLLLSFKSDTGEQEVVGDEEALTAGSFVDAEVTGIASNGINLRYPVTGEALFLPTLHLSDYTHLCSFILAYHQTQLEKTIREGVAYVLHDLLVVCGKLKLKPALVTMKKLMKVHMKEKGYITTIDDFKVGTVQPGFIRNIVPYGCFVDFPHQLTGLAPTRFLTDHFISRPSDIYQETQTVWAKVQSLDEFKGQLSLTLRPSDLKLSLLDDDNVATQTLLSHFQAYISERSSILDEMKSKLDTSVWTTSLSALADVFVPGGLVTGHVTLITDSFVTVEVKEGVIGRVDRELMHGATPSRGSEVVCCILDIDLTECFLVLSLNSKLVSQPASSSPATPAKGPKERGKKLKSIAELGLSLGSSVVGVVEHKTPYYLVMSCTTLIGSMIVYGLMDTGQLAVLPLNFNSLRVGKQMIGRVLSLAGDCGDLPVVMVTDTPLRSHNIMSWQTKTSDSIPNLDVGDIISAVVQNTKPYQINVKYQLWRGRVHCTLAKDPDGETPVVPSVKSSRELTRQRISVFGDVSVGDVVKARVVKIREKYITRQGSKRGATIKVLELTTRQSLLDAGVELDPETLMKKSFSIGEEVDCVIKQVTVKGLFVHLSPQAEGFVPLFSVSEDIKVLNNLKKYFVEGQQIRCVVKREGKKHTILSIISPTDAPVSEGDIIYGHVYQVLTGYCLVVTPFGKGRVDITDVSDHYCDDPFQEVKKAGNLFKCCVVHVEGDKLDLSLRNSRTNPSDKVEVRDPEIQELGDLVKGQVVRGYVKAVTDVGVFVRLGRNIDGRVLITHLVDGFVKNFKKIHSPGDLVNTKVLEVDGVKKNVELSLRQSLVDPEAAKIQRKKQDKKEKKKKGEAKSTDQESVEEMSGSVSDAESSNESESDEDVNMDTASRPTLQVSGGFKWTVGEGTDPEDTVGGTPESLRGSDDSEEDEDLENIEVKISRRQKRKAKKIEEIELYHKELSLLELEKEPESAEDFDKLLLATPNSSVLWVQYMAFYLHTAEVDKARTVAQRALRTISFREENEKLNVWVGWMNLENLYGTQETLVKVFDSALQQNDPLEVYKRLVTIYEQSKKNELASRLYQTMTKKFSGVQWVWSKYATFLMKQGKQNHSRTLLQRALKSLASKQEHISMISKFSQLEFKHGEPERGRTMFESLLSAHPRKVDVWSVYIDMVLKTGDIEKVRDIFERAIHLKISAKKMKFIFKRYLEFERQHGTQALMDEVVEKARNFVESHRNNSSLLPDTEQ